MLNCYFHLSQPHDALEFFFEIKFTIAQPWETMLCHVIQTN